MAETSEGSLSLPVAKQTKMRIVLPAVVLVTSFYYSFSFTGGIVLGYLLCKLFCHVFLHKGRVNKILVDFGNWKLHLHHWIMGIMLLGIVWVIDYFYLPTFFAGFVIGIIIQDIYDYTDWHQIIIRKDKTPGNLPA